MLHSNQVSRLQATSRTSWMVVASTGLLFVEANVPTSSLTALANHKWSHKDGLREWSTYCLLFLYDRISGYLATYILLDVDLWHTLRELCEFSCTFVRQVPFSLLKSIVNQISNFPVYAVWRHEVHHQSKASLQQLVQISRTLLATVIRGNFLLHQHLRGTWRAFPFSGGSKMFTYCWHVFLCKYRMLCQQHT